MLPIELFGFRALWSPYYFVVILIVTILYFLIINIWRNKFPDSEKVSKGKQIFFVIGMLLLYTAQGSPIDLFSHLMFTAHMVQMAILYLVVPPLLLLGIPDWLLRKIISFPFIKQLIKNLSRPLVALVLFNGIFSIYHLPAIFDIVKTDVWLHAIYTGILFFLAMMMWWPIFTPMIEMQKMSPLRKIAYIFANGAIITPACALIIFADTSMYATYSDPKIWLNALQLCVPRDMISSFSGIGPEMYNMLPTLEDQQLGGIVMKILQEIIYGSVLGYIFVQWMRQERIQDEQNIAKMIAQSQS